MTRKDIKNTAEALNETGREALATAKSGISEAATQAKSALREGADNRAEAAKDVVADQGQRLSRDLRDMADTHSEGSLQGSPLDTVASGVSDISERLRGWNLSSILDETEAFVRRNPGAVVAGAAIAGFAIARFARASAEPRRHAAAAAERKVPSHRPDKEPPF